MRVLAIQNCARCKRDHDELEAYMFQNPVRIDSEWSFSYWATCPTTHEPVLIHSRAFQKPKPEGNS